jgi:protein-S-isoprenylcysteine O-methyltransferase Ste14
VKRLWLAARSLFWVAVLPGTVGVYVPWRYFGVNRIRPDLGRPLHVAGLAAILAGAALLVACVWEFARSGRGTLSPVDPPRQLVIHGLYRHVRNPMYLSVTLMVLGQVLLTGSRDLLAYVALVFVGFNLFVMGYEEPNLRHRFGPAYEDYTRNVGRWLPRLRPWRP